MERKVVNPWSWQDRFAYVQANEVADARRMLICAGQTSIDAEGRPAHEGNMRAQIELALDNLEAVLQAADFTLADVVRLNYYTTDVDRFFAEYRTIADRLTRAGCRPANTTLGVARLAFPELLVEIEATAVA